MAYVKTTWVDEVLADDERYDIKEDGGAAFKATMQIALATAVTTPGTAVNAANLNHIEDGIEAVEAVAVAAAIPVKHRQGGSATAWATSGTNNYVPTSTLIQSGVVNTGAGAYADITFPVAFGYSPQVFVTLIAKTGIAIASTLSAAGVTISTIDLAGDPLINAIVNWIAVGPEA